MRVFGFRYRFDGLGAATVDMNGVMDRMADMAESAACNMGDAVAKGEETDKAD